MRKAHKLAVLATGFGLLLSSWSYAQRPEGGPPGGGRPEGRPEGGRGEGGLVVLAVAPVKGVVPADRAGT